jgi:hypothetical protein
MHFEKKREVLSMKACWRISFLLALSAFLTSVNTLAFAADEELSRATLRGLKGVYVAVEDLDPEIERDGLTRDQIHSDVELKLQQAGIKVLSKEEWKREKGSPYLYVNAHIMKVMNGVYIFNITTEFIQEVRLVRNSDIKAPAAIWSAETLGISDHVRDVRDPARDRVDKFISAYLSVNPRQEAKKVEESE